MENGAAARQRAPAIRYHDGQFYIYCGDPDRGIFMVRTSDPAGVWEAPVWVVKAKGLIDPCPLWDEDGNGVGDPVMKHRKPELRSSGVFQPAESDRFDNLELGLQWQWTGLGFQTKNMNSWPDRDFGRAPSSDSSATATAHITTAGG